MDPKDENESQQYHCYYTNQWWGEGEEEIKHA
jgi:hypothetical protein